MHGVPAVSLPLCPSYLCGSARGGWGFDPWGCSRYTGPITDLVKELREELIFEPYAGVDWTKARSFICDVDLYTPHTMLLEIFFGVVDVYEKVAPSFLRNAALDWVYKLLQKEDEFTKFIDIGKAKNPGVLDQFARISRISPPTRAVHCDPPMPR